MAAVEPVSGESRLASTYTLSQIRMKHTMTTLRISKRMAPRPPATSDHGYVEHDGARIWYATYGSGSPVILLHGGLGHSGNWGYQVPTLVSSGHRAVLIDSRWPRPQYARFAAFYV
jgi:hypothetical protein